MTSLEEFAEAFIKYVSKNHSDRVSLIFSYGSHARGTAIETSDLDLAYVTDTGELDCLYNSFVYEGIGNEFWPISWKRLERIARAEEHYPVAAPMLAYAKVLWGRTEEDIQRFNDLKKRIEEYKIPEKKEHMINKALEIYIEVYTDTAKLNLEEIVSGTRYLAVKTLIDCCEALGYANQTYFTCGWGSNHQEVLALKHRPKRLEQYTDTIVSSKNPNEIKEAVKNLAKDTRNILLELQKQYCKPSGLEKHLTDYYPGILEYVNKIRTSEASGNKTKAVISAYTIQAELTNMISDGETGVSNTRFNTPSEISEPYQNSVLPDLLENTETLTINADKLDTETQKLFKELNLSLNKVENLLDFIEKMKEKCIKTSNCN